MEKKTPPFEEMIRMRVVFSVLNHPGGRHGFDILDDDARTRQIIRCTLEFLRDHLAP